MKVSVIIVNYNTQALLKQCLSSVFELTKDISFEVIVVDNASHDGSQEMLKKDFPQVKLIESKENLGFGKANNLGASSAKFEYLFLLNSDTLLLNNAIKILADFMDAHPKCGSCGGNLYNEDMSPSFSFAQITLGILTVLIGATHTGFIVRLIYRNGSYCFNPTNNPVHIHGFIIGADMMIRTKLYQQLEGFNPKLFMYHEDVELCNRIRKAGYSLYSNPLARIIHYGGKSSNKKTENQLRAQGIVRYYRESYSALTCWIIKTISLLGLVPAMLYFLLTCNIRRYKRSCALYKFWIKTWRETKRQ